MDDGGDGVVGLWAPEQVGDPSVQQGRVAVRMGSGAAWPIRWSRPGFSKEGSDDGRISSLVHPGGPLLAAGSAHRGYDPDRVADSAAVQDRRGGRRRAAPYRVRHPDAAVQAHRQVLTNSGTDERSGK